MITAVVVEGRSQSDVARAYGVSQPWVSRLVARYRAEGETAFTPRSRRPTRSPSATSAGVVELVLRLRKQLAEQGLDAGPHTIVWHLHEHHHQQLASVSEVPSVSTVWRILARHRQIIPAPAKRPRSSYTRFQAELPNQMWQTDFTHYRLDTGRGVRGLGTDVEVLNILDDHSRYLLASVAAPRVTGTLVVEVFRAAVTAHGAPASVLSDNGMVFTTRFAGGRARAKTRNGFETELARHGIEQKNSKPNHPQTCGKVERLHQTQKRWLAARSVQPATIAELQVLLEQFAAEYNTRRPHRSLARRTPLAAYLARPKAAPSGDASPADVRVRRDRVDTSGVVTLRYDGRLHHIGIGRAHARTHILLLVADRDIRIVNATTGQLIRELVLDPTRDYQPTRPGTQETPNP
ncbi:homeodomain-containing protein [Actinomycetospora succinea]|uniref:Homeodomain-containing protein n=1 Tax=Actinomycetospora succinea TaxID=663603 RepID=A0A4R6VX91_9PSEU|nr:DDE-type integrase/transposase/recombinase [Actinomycetospora succinea]TDQ65165.1 homeodomain-containing protein [Actinomycetospora succinea]